MSVMIENNASDSETDQEYELERAIVEAEAACNSDDGENSDSNSEDDGIRNHEALQRAIQSTSYPDNMPWIESLAITHTKPIDCADASDDLDREVKLCVFFCCTFARTVRTTDLFFLSSYQMALNSVKQAVDRLEQAGIPYKRPDDYYAEMMKSDEHMAKVVHLCLLLQLLKNYATTVRSSASCCTSARSSKCRNRTRKWFRTRNSQSKFVRISFRSAPLPKRTSLRQFHSGKKVRFLLDFWVMFLRESTVFADKDSNKLSSESLERAIEQAQGGRNRKKNTLPKKSLKRQRKDEKFSGRKKARTGDRKLQSQGAESNGKKKMAPKKRPNKNKRTQQRSSRK